MQLTRDSCREHSGQINRGLAHHRGPPVPTHLPHANVSHASLSLYPSPIQKMRHPKKAGGLLWKQSETISGAWRHRSEKGFLMDRKLSQGFWETETRGKERFGWTWPSPESDSMFTRAIRGRCSSYAYGRIYSAGTGKLLFFLSLLN